MPVLYDDAARLYDNAAVTYDEALGLYYYGRSVNPTDGATLAATSVAVTPPGSMQALDLVLLMGLCPDVSGDQAWSVSVTGGQSWTAVGTTINGAGSSLQRWYCVFNGTWGANPTVAYNGAGTRTITGAMVVFRPSIQAIWWELENQAESFLSDDAAPYDLTFPDQSITRYNHVAFVEWHRDALHTMSLQTAGWTNPSSETQWRNDSVAGTDLLLSAGYRIFSGLGPTGTVTNRAATGPTTQGASYMGFYEITDKPEVNSRQQRLQRSKRW